MTGFGTIRNRREGAFPAAIASICGHRATRPGVQSGVRRGRSKGLDLIARGVARRAPRRGGNHERTNASYGPAARAASGRRDSGLRARRLRGSPGNRAD